MGVLPVIASLMLLAISPSKLMAVPPGALDRCRRLAWGHPRFYLGDETGLELSHHTLQPFFPGDEGFGSEPDLLAQPLHPPLPNELTLA